MSPSPNPFDVNSFIEKHKSTLTAEEIAGIAETQRGYLRDQDYQRLMNSTKATQAEWEQTFQADHDRLKQWEADSIAARTKLSQIEQRFGPVDRFLATADPNVMRTPSGDYVARTDVEALKAEFDQKLGTLSSDFGNFAKGTYHMIINMPRFADTYRDKFHKSFDGGKFMEYIEENKINDPDIAFKLFTAEDEQKLIEEKHQTDIKQAREEGARDARSRHHIPEDAGRGPVRSPLTMPIRPITPLTTTQPPATTTPPPPPPPVNTVHASSSSRLNSALSGTEDLRTKMQNDFFANKDKP